MLCSLCVFASKAMAMADIGRERGGSIQLTGKDLKESNRRKGPGQEEVQVTKSNQSLGVAGRRRGLRAIIFFLLPQSEIIP